MRYQGGMEGEVVVSNWRRLLGERAVLVNECTQVPRYVLAEIHHYDRLQYSFPYFLLLFLQNSLSSFPFLHLHKLNSVFFEQGGGGNGGESYTLPWYFAARHTRTDQFEKRGKMFETISCFSKCNISWFK